MKLCVINPGSEAASCCGGIVVPPHPANIATARPKPKRLRPKRNEVIGYTPFAVTGWQRRFDGDEHSPVCRKSARDLRTSLWLLRLHAFRPAKPPDRNDTSISGARWVRVCGSLKRLEWLVLPASRVSSAGPRSVQALGAWYKCHLAPARGSGSRSHSSDDPDPKALTVWAPFDFETTYR